MLLKYEHLICHPTQLLNIYFNSLYIICKIALDLKYFIDDTSPYHEKFQILAQKYNALAFQMFQQSINLPILYITLFQMHYHQESPLIDILFRNTMFFADILNIPHIYQVLYQLWKGNIRCSSNFYLETYYYQALKPSYSIMVPKNLSKDTAVSI